MTTGADLTDYGYIKVLKLNFSAKVRPAINKTITNGWATSCFHYLHNYTLSGSVTLSKSSCSQIICLSGLRRPATSKVVTYEPAYGHDLDNNVIKHYAT